MVAVSISYKIIQPNPKSFTDSHLDYILAGPLNFFFCFHAKLIKGHYKFMPLVAQLILFFFQLFFGFLKI